MKMWLLLLGLAVTSAAAAGPGSCAGRCGEVYTRGQQCACDFSCLQHHECCPDFESTCTTAQSCLGRCGEAFRRGQPCDCDPLCIGYNTCCRDYRLHCDASVSHPRTSQHVTAASAGKRKPQRSSKESNSESEEWFTGAFGLLGRLPARSAVSTHQLQHGVLPASIPTSPNSARGSSPHGYGAPVSHGAPYGPHQGLSSPAAYRPRPSTMQDGAQALGLSVVEGGTEAPGIGLCSDSPINALTALSNGTLLIFKGELFWSVDPVTRTVGPPQGITDTLGVPAPVTTVFTRSNCHRNTYIIKGDQLWRFDENMVMEQGFPKPLASEFPGVMGRISAALAVPATRSSLETVYFFNNGDVIQRFTFSPDSTPSCSARSSLKTQLPRAADVLLSGEISIKVSLKGFPNPVTSALSMPSPQRSDRYHHYVFTGPLFFSVHIADNWPAPTQPDPSSVLVPILSPDAMATNTRTQSVHRPPNSITVWLRCP
ncbi:proteoglycan 4a [Betta splendens]|uniref:Proteoglycan 4a n=1 Tax=Betta splendens TaxID=158456 RepID=A0A6P7KX12_BETSP|nr:proteoglycan 4a [Betta splendens]